MRNKTYINNGKVQVGVDLENGGCIFHISEVTRKTNLVNHHDIGRYLQQSYYGDLDGSVYEGIPWNYNPIQGGSWYHQNVRSGCFGHFLCTDEVHAMKKTKSFLP